MSRSREVTGGGGWEWRNEGESSGVEEWEEWKETEKLQWWTGESVTVFRDMNLWRLSLVAWHELSPPARARYTVYHLQWSSRVWLLYIFHEQRAWWLPWAFNHFHFFECLRAFCVRNIWNSSKMLRQTRNEYCNEQKWHPLHWIMILNSLLLHNLSAE